MNLKLQGHREWAIALVLPIIYSCVYLFIGDERGFYYWTENQDPDYPYLLNGLGLLQGIVPKHVDHPGTPLQMWIAIVVWIGHGVRHFMGAEGLVKDVLTHTEDYLRLINFSLLGLTVLALWGVGATALKLSRSIPVALLLQLTPLLMIKTQLGNEPSRVSPDVMSFAVAQLLVILLLKWLYREPEQTGTKIEFAVALGAVLGLGIAVKVTFLPMLLYLLLIRGFRLQVIAVAITVGSFIAATLPIISRYSKVWDWMIGVATHTGNYDGGDVGLINHGTFVEDSDRLISPNPVFFTVLGVATVALVLYTLKRRMDLPASRLLLITVVVAWLQVFLAIKEHGYSRYLSPSAGLMGLLIVCLVLSIAFDKFRRTSSHLISSHLISSH